MAIETAGQSSAQTKLVKESREERLTRLFDLEMKIQEMRDAKDKLKAQYNAVNNDIKAHEKDKVELLNLINSGQGTFIPVATTEQAETPEDLDGDLPTDEELAEFDTPDGGEASNPEENQDMLPEEGIEGGDAEPEDLDVDEASEGATENSVEEYSKNIPNGEPELPQAGEAPLEPDFQLATPDHWRLMDFDTLTMLGKVKNKKDPIVGAIYGLPSSLWNKDGKTHYQVQGASVTEEDGEAFWEVYCDLLDENEIQKQENISN